MTATPLHLPQQDVVKGSLYMAIAMAAFVTNDTLVKLLASELPVGTLVFVRGAFASVILLAATAMSGNLQKPPLIFSRDVTLRAGTDVISTLLFITALVHMPIGNLTAIVQAAPLVVTALAAISSRNAWDGEELQRSSRALQASS